MDIKAYLERIDYDQTVTSDYKTLRALQLAHMSTVPFENLDIGLKRPIRLDEESLWDKLIVRRRGGFCYELNGLFAWLLKEIGFQVTYLNARDYFPNSDTFGIEFDHLALLVQIPGESTRWLADVGYGDNFTIPMNIDSREEQAEGGRGYWLEPLKGGYQLWRRNYDGSHQRQYSFDLTAHNFPSAYEATCLYHQTSPESIFTQRRLISRLTPDGRVTLEDQRMITTINGRKSEKTFKEDEFPKLLKEYFSVEL